MANFCINCGSKLEDNYNFCINCGTKVNQSDIKQHNPSLNQYSDSLEKKKAKKELKRVVGGSILFSKNFIIKLHENGLDIVDTGSPIRQQVEKEIDSGQIKSGGVEFRVNQLIIEYKIKKEEEIKKIKMIDEILKSDEIKSEIRKNSIDEKYIISIKCSLKDKIVEKNEIMNEEEIKNFIKVELEKASEEQEKIRIAEEQEKARLAKEREMRRKQQEKIKMNGGGYCSWRCKHYYEEFLDSRGGIIGNFDSGGYVEYYCRLGHSIADGCFCKDFE